MRDSIEITKRDIEKMKLMTSEELAKLDFHELCAYLKLLDEAEKIMKGSEA